MDAAAELGRNPVSKHQIQPEYGDEQADAGRVCRNRLARSNSQARTGTEEYYFPVQLTTSRIGNLTRLIHTLLYVMTILTYILLRLEDVGICPAAVAYAELLIPSTWGC